MVNADYQRTYEFSNSIFHNSTAQRRKREDLFENASFVSILDQDGNTAIVASICVRPEITEDNVTLVFGNVSFVGVGTDSLDFYVNGTEIGSLTLNDVAQNPNASAAVSGQSGQIGEPITLHEGNYTLNITAQTSQNAMELFSIQVNVSRQIFTEDIFCGQGFEIQSGNE